MGSIFPFLLSYISLFLYITCNFLIYYLQRTNIRIAVSYTHLESEAVFGTGAAKDDALQAGATKESIFSDVGDLWQVDACQFPASDESSDSYIGDRCV